MVNSFRLRLLITLSLPMLVFIALMGLGLTYYMEYHVFIPAVAQEMLVEANLIAQEFPDGSDAWTNPTAAQVIITRLNLPGSFQIDLLDPQGRLLATSQPEKRSLVGQPLPDTPGTGDLPESGQWRVNSPGPGGAPILHILVPVLDSQNQIIGRLYMERQIPELHQGMRQAREWVVAAMLVGIVLNTILALVLSSRITRPLRQITQEITSASLEGQPKQIKDQGLSEFDALAHALNQLQERRYEIENTRKQMLANLVHELSRPLGSLRIAAHALLTGAESNTSLRLDLLHGMVDRIDWLGHLVNDLTLAYLPEHTLELRTLPFEPGPWLNSLLPLWIEMAHHKGIEWHASWPGNTPIIEGDPARLEQALGNLVSNAIKFSPPGGKVSLTAGWDAGHFWISVADNGPGIPPEDVQHIFEPFYRAEQTARKAPGLGLGLSIAKTIVEAHGGMVEVHSHPNEGSQFTICLPYHP